MRGGNGIKKIEKVAIVTIYSRLNYGNRLQNYAIQEILKGIGVEPFTIKNFSKFGLFRKKMDPDFTIGEQKTRQDKLYDIKKEIFLKFNEQYLQTYEKDIDMNNIYNNQNILDGFDCFVVGSDQVWNYNIKSLSELNFLPFDTDKKKISFAASLCLDSINDDFKPYYKNYLSKFSSISVREEKAKEILENLLHRDIERVIEPILMIRKNKWEEIMVKPEYELKNKYILIYMISDLPINNKITKYSQKNDFEIIDINSISSEHFLTSPNEFIYLMRNSELIITDSYHAGIFALIFNKRCQLYKRSGNYEGMNCRIDTIKELLDLDIESDFQEYEDYVEFKNEQDIYINQTIINRTNKALNFLKSNMKERE